MKGAAVLDALGFDGYAVCGQYYLQRLQDQYPEMTRGSSKRETSELYRFGGGTALAWTCARIKIRETTSRHRKRNMC